MRDHYVVFFFFKQKTAYEMRISDWSSACALPICADLVGGVAEDEGGNQLRPAGGEPLGDEAADREAADDGALDGQVVEQRGQVADVVGDAVGRLVDLREAVAALVVERSEERRVGTVCVGTFGSRWSPFLL